MTDIITPYSDVPPVDFWKQLLKLNEKRKILFSPPPINQMVRNPVKFEHCFVCNRHTFSMPYFSLSVCEKCYKNRTNVNEFKNNVMVSSMDNCAICGKFFTVGIVALNVPLCDWCRVYTTNVIRKSFGLNTFRVSL
jgi:hypothetical protein